MNIAGQILDGAAAPAETAPQAADQSTPANPTLEMIAKMERRNKLREQELNGRMSEYEQLKKWKEEHEGLFSRLDQDPLSLLKEKGWDLERINKHALETLGDDDLDPVAKRLKTLEESTQTMEQRIAEAVAKAVSEKEAEYGKRDQERQVEVFKSNLKAHLAQHKDKYEFIMAEEDDAGVNAVYDVIWEDLQRRKDSHDPSQPFMPMSYDEAAERVEAFLDKRAQRYAQLKKFQKLINPGESAGLEAFLAKSEPQTITARHTAQSAIDPKELSEKERIQKAIEGIKSGAWNT